MSSYSAKELIKILEQHGWYEVRQVGSHKQFKHPDKPNKITVPVTQVKKNIEMHILRQAGLKHLMKRRNTKPQPKKPQTPYKAPEILHGLSQTPDAGEAAKNTPCFNYTVSQLEKLADKPKEIKENKEKEMQTLGEVARVTITSPKPQMSRSEAILDYLKDPIHGFNTTGVHLAKKVIAQYGLDCAPDNLNGQVSALVRRGKIIRKKVGNGLFNFRLATKSDKTVNNLLLLQKPQENASMTVVEPVKTVAEPIAEPEPVVEPAVSVTQTDGGVTISITLNLNLSLKG